MDLLPNPDEVSTDELNIFKFVQGATQHVVAQSTQQNDTFSDSDLDIHILDCFRIEPTMDRFEGM